MLTEAAIMGKRDELRGLKRERDRRPPDPAGTGMAFHPGTQGREDMDDRAPRHCAEEAELASPNWPA